MRISNLIQASLLPLALLLGACGGSSEAADGAVFVFTAIPDEHPTEQTARFQPVADYLAAELGVEVKYQPVNQYSASVQAFKNGDVHGAWFGGLSGVQARLAMPGAKAIAQGDKDPQFYSYFIANTNSGLTAGADFPLSAAGKKFTFGSEGSTSGRLMPEYFIRENTGKEPQKFFSDVGFSGNHPATIAAVSSGAFDVGAVNYTDYDKATAEEKANTFVLWQTPRYADYNFTVRGDLDATFGAGFTTKLTKAWLAMPSAMCEASFSRGKMIAAKNDDFGSIEKTALDLGLAR